MKKVLLALGVVLIIVVIILLWVKGPNNKDEKITKAITTDNIVSCKKFDGIDKVDCISGIAVKQANVNLCAELANNQVVNPYDGSQSNGKDICIAAVAEVVLDVKLCQRVNDPILKDNCLYSYALKKQDLAVCNQILTEGTRSECNELLVLIKPGYCEGLPTEKQDICFFRRGANLENTGDCVKSGKMKDLCYVQVAKRLKDKSICNNIQSDFAKRNCIKESE